MGVDVRIEGTESFPLEIHGKVTIKIKADWRNRKLKKLRVNSPSSIGLVFMTGSPNNIGENIFGQSTAKHPTTIAMARMMTPLLSPGSDIG